MERRYLISDYTPDEIYNVDETGIYYKALRNKTLCLAKEKISGFKENKDRLTLLLCSNMTGSHKLIQ